MNRPPPLTTLRKNLLLVVSLVGNVVLAFLLPGQSKKAPAEAETRFSNSLPLAEGHSPQSGIASESEAAVLPRDDRLSLDDPTYMAEKMKRDGYSDGSIVAAVKSAAFAATKEKRQMRDGMVLSRMTRWNPAPDFSSNFNRMNFTRETSRAIETQVVAALSEVGIGPLKYLGVSADKQAALLKLVNDYTEIAEDTASYRVESPNAPGQKGGRGAMIANLPAMRKLTEDFRHDVHALLTEDEEDAYYRHGELPRHFSGLRK